MLVNPPLNVPVPYTALQPLFSEEWAEFFGRNVSPDHFDKLCIEGRLRGSRIRSIIWRVLLKSLPFDRREWSSILSRSRSRYDMLKKEVVVNPHDNKSVSLDIYLNNPLSLDKASPWQQYFEDCELRDCIDKDVKRTFSDVQFFRHENTQRILADILFVYAKCNPHIAYKQGMHEILAPLIFVIYLDLQSFGHLVEQNALSDVPQLDTACLLKIFDPSFLENDAFDMFSQLMILLEGWYITTTESVSRPMLVPAFVDGVVESFCRDAEPLPNSELLRKLRFIGDKILAEVDPILYNHLNKLEIHPQLYGIRWLRLLFGREFPIHDVLYVWDAIFASRPLLSFVDYLFVAFLEQIRHLLIGSDYTTCLQYLMRYPPIVDVHAFIQLALHIKSPKKYAKPKQPGLSNYTGITVAGASHPNRERSNFVMRTSPVISITQPENGGVKGFGGKKKSRDSFVGKFVDTIIERRNSESLPSSSTHSTNEINLLKEHISSLQSRLNTVNLVSKIASKRIEACISDLSLMEGNKVLRQRLAAELQNISDQLVRSTVSEERVRNVGIPDASVERSGVELAREADNFRSPVKRTAMRNTRPSVYGDRELVDMKEHTKRQTLLR